MILGIPLAALYWLGFAPDGRCAACGRPLRRGQRRVRYRREVFHAGPCRAD